MGTTINPTYTQVDVGVPFYGVYYGQSALPLSAEKIYYLTNETLKNCKVFDYESNAYMDMYDMEKANGKDPYELFLGGSKSLITIETRVPQPIRSLSCSAIHSEAVFLLCLSKATQRLRWLI